MRPLRPKTLFIPVLGLLLAALVLLTVVVVTTYFNLQSGRAQAQRVLAAQASAIISGFTAGLRTGWRYWVWRVDSLQGLVQEMSQAGDVAFIMLLDKKGRILAHSNPALVGQAYDPTGQVVDQLATDRVNGWFGSNKLYLAGRRLPADERMGPRSSYMRGMGMMGPSGRQRPRLTDDRFRPEFIIVGLKTAAYVAARRQQLNHALLMGGLLFVLGSGAIYFIFVAQNYRTIDRTLSDLSTYTAGIVDNMPGGLITLDAGGEPVMVNRTAREMFGWGDGSESRLTRDPIIAALSREYGSRLREGSIIDEEFEAPITPEETIPLAVSAAAVPAGTSDQSPGAVFILRDLRQIRALEEQVRRSEKLAAVGRLAAGVAHEVRNPLSSMRGLARFLGRNFGEDTREAEYLKVMIDEIDRLDRVITGLLDFARPRLPDLHPMDLNEAARHTTGLVKDDLHLQGIRLREGMTAGNPMVLADRDMAIQAMLNVLLNAIEAMPDGGRLTVRTETSGREAYFMVEDTGPGFPIEDRSRFFDPFFTTKKKGTGLGLAQVARIMEAHNSRIELGGNPGSGARVTLFFPLVLEETREDA